MSLFCFYCITNESFDGALVLEVNEEEIGARNQCMDNTLINALINTFIRRILIDKFCCSVE